ncbi:hypothetical protein [Vibrio diabolicus]|uniref:hypothetical protein n=1 Tax=Vibrio diabolicus TaxID=50719 RepID=UPI00211A27B3|nr:hypothetical protein [Vibrio diabolicus]MCQ9067099.1 hypothetical protein [Vibrio diabolicus]
MIDSRLKQYWLDEIETSAHFLEGLYRSKEWNDRLEYEVEKSIFVGFYAIRKLLESGHLTQRVSSLNWTLTAYPLCENTNSNEWIRNYNHSKGFDKQLGLKKICDQFVHSVHFAPFVPDGRFCVGFYFVSDRDRNKEIYYIQIVNVLNVFLSVANGKNVKLKIEHNENSLSVNLANT